MLEAILLGLAYIIIIVLLSGTLFSLYMIMTMVSGIVFVKLDTYQTWKLFAFVTRVLVPLAALGLAVILGILNPLGL